MNRFINQHTLLCTFGASLLLGFSGCQDEDFGYTAEEIAYQSNFEKKFGKISDDQVWDFSSYNLHKLGLKGGPSADDAAIGSSVTRAYDATEAQVNAMRTVQSTFWDVPDNTINWLNRNMMERYDHRSEGQSFKLINPYYDENNSNEARDFLIIPIYQGSSGMTWDLHLVDDNNDYTIWEKSKDLEYKVDYTQFEEFFYNGSETNSVWNADPDKAIPATNIKLGGAFGGKITNQGPRYGWVMCFELPTYNSKMPGSANGSFSGSFYVYQEDGNHNITHKAKITNIGEYGNFTFNRKGRGDDGALNQDNSVVFDGVVQNQGEGYPAEDDSNIKIKLADDFSNLLLETTSRTNCTFDPYDPQRIKIFVKSTRTLSDCPWLKDDHYTQLVDFEKDNNNNDVSVSFFKGHTINRNNVHTKVMKIDTKKIGPEFSLYLQTKYSDEYNLNYAKPGTKHRSDGTPSMMLALQDFSKDSQGESPLSQTEVNAIFSSVGLTAPSSDCEYMVIGCEDANGSASDWDYNDVVFLVVGYPKVPKIAKNVISKRYMIEDLGSTFDFDFNDIVVDVTQEDVLDIAHNTYSRKQIASIAHLCGTIPFEVFVGGQSMGKLMGQNNNDSEYGFDPKSVGPAEYKRLYVKTYNGTNSWSASASAPANSTNGLPWEPDQNNITVAVWPQAASVEAATGSGSNSVQNSVNQLDVKDAQRIEFPARGKFPYIIAVDQDINWMTELTSVPRSWFHTEENLTDYDQNFDKEHPSIFQETLTDEQCAGLGLGYLVPTSKITNTTGQANGQTIGITTLDLGEVFTNNKYRSGNITISIVVDRNCPDYTEVKGTFVQTTGEALPDSYYDFENFEIYNGINSIAVKKQSILLTSEEIMDVAENGDLKFNVSYATFGFGSEWSPRARMLVQWDPAVPIGITSTDWSPNGAGDDYGTKLNYTYTAETTNTDFQQITVGSAFDESYTADQNAYITFVLPGNYTLEGTFYSFDNKGFCYSGPTNFETTSNGSGPRAYTIKLSEEYRKMLGGGFGNQKGNFRYVIYSATKDGNSVQVNSNDVQIFVNWDANYLSLNNEVEKDVTITIPGDNKVATLKSASDGAINVSGYDSDMIDVSVSGKDITITPKAVGTTTITAYQTGTSGKYEKDSNRIKINVTVEEVAVPEADIDLSSIMYHSWNDDGTIKTYDLSSWAGPHLNQSTSGVFGDVSNVNNTYYADISSADYLVATINGDGYARFIFNRNGDSRTEIITSYASTDDKIKKVDNEDGTYTYVIDLNKVKTATGGTAHLNAIKTWSDNDKVNMTSLKLDKYNCPAETNVLPRTLWSGEVSKTNWEAGCVTVEIPSRLFENATYRNTKMRITGEKLSADGGDYLMRPNAGAWNGTAPIEVGYYNNEGPIDVNMDKKFFDDIKTAGSIVFNGFNMKVTKVELIANSDADYNLMLDEPSGWNSSFTRSPLTVTLKSENSSSGTGCQWPLTNDLTNTYSKIKVEIGNITKIDENSATPEVWLTTSYNDGSDHYQSTSHSTSSTTFTIDCKANGNNVSQVYIESNVPCEFVVRKAYLTNE